MNTTLARDCPPPAKFRAALWWIVAGSALLRLLLVARVYEPLAFWAGDPRTYADILDGLVRGHADSAMWVWPPGLPAAALPFRWAVDSAIALHAASWLAGVALPALLVACARRTALVVPFGVAAFVSAFFPEAAQAAAWPLPATVAVLGSVAAAVCLERAVRTGSLPWAGLGGVAVAWGALARPEVAISAPLFALVALIGRRAAWRPVAAYGVVGLLLLGPYVVAFHGASGVWGLSIKPQLNVLKEQVYARSDDFGSRRVEWDAFLDANRNDEGRIDPRAIAELADTRGYFFGSESPGRTAANVAYAFRRNAWWVNGLWGVGLLGLLLGRSGRRERAYALATAAPIVSVAMLYPPVERYALVAIPALGLGVGMAVDAVRPRLGRRQGAGLVLAGVALAVVGSVETFELTRDSHWKGRYGEYLVARARGDGAAAEAIVREAIEMDPRVAEAHETLGALLQDRGDWAAAEQAFREGVARGGTPVSLAALCARSGRTDEAISLMEPLRRSPPETADYWSLRGHLAMSARDFADAAASFAMSESLGGPADLLGINRARALVPLGRVDEARHLLLRARESADPDVREAAESDLERLERALSELPSPPDAPSSP